MSRPTIMTEVTLKKLDEAFAGGRQPCPLDLDLRIQGDAARQVDVELTGCTSFLAGQRELEEVFGDVKIFPGDPEPFIRADGYIVGSFRVGRGFRRRSREVKNHRIERPLGGARANWDLPQFGDVLSDAGVDIGKTAAVGKPGRNANEWVGKQPSLYDVRAWTDL